MNWIDGLFSIPSALQAVVVLSLVCTVGLGLGKIRIAGISLGIAFVFFFGIAAGSFGLQVDEQMLNYCETFGLVIFVYTLGLSVGPTFFGSFRHEGTLFNLWSLGVIFLGTIMSVVLSYAMNVPMSNMVGILCGATTNTPALGAAQQALQHAGHSGGPAALATAVTYPLGVVGVIFAMIFLRKFFVKPSDLVVHSGAEDDHTYIGQFVVLNPAINGKSIAEIAQGTHRKFIISRIWRGEDVIVPMSSTVLQTNDNLLVATKRDEVSAMEILFGQKVNRDLNKEQVDWNHLDTKVESRVIILSNGVLNGKKLGQLHLRDAYNVNVSRVIRADIKLLATQDLVLRYGDRLTLVGQPEAIDHAEKFLGNSVKTLNEPNLAVIFLGMVFGLALGTIPINLPGMESPILATVVRPEGLLWIGLGFVLTVVPVVIVGLIALRLKKFDFGTICGILCGSMANPMALGYANDTVKGETSNISYASVYPLGMFARVIIAQILVMFFV